MSKEVWSTDALGFPKKFKARIEDDGSVWKVGVLGFPKRMFAKIYEDGTSGKSMGWDCQVGIWGRYLRNSQDYLSL